MKKSFLNKSPARSRAVLHLRRQGLQRQEKGRRAQCAFTLLEILVVLAVISILTTVVFGGISKVKEKMLQTQEVSSARFLINTFHMISVDKGRLFSAVEYEAGTSPDAQAENIRYPTHMVEYTGEAEFEKALYFYPDQQELLQKIKKVNTVVGVSYIRSLYPALGMNSPIVGGEYYNGAYQESSTNVANAHEVNRPQKLIVFISAGTSSMGYGLDSDVIHGYFKVVSPYIGRIPTMYMWDSARRSMPSNTGNVHFRWDKQAVAAFFDGSVRLVGEKEVKDPEYWLNDTSAFNL